MPLVTIGGQSRYYRLDGADDRPVVMLSHSLGLDHGMWDEQAADLAPYFRVLRYDTRGHGASAPSPGDYTIEQLAQDAIALADHLGIASFAFCGLSLGGMIGQWLAAHAPDRVTQIVLANTSPRVADPPAMDVRRRRVLEGGMSSIADAVMGRFFSPGVLERCTPRAAWARRTLLATDPVGYAGCCAAIRDMDQRALLARILTPTLVIGGDADVATPWAGHGDVLARDIAGARAVRLPAGHVSNLERPRSFSSALVGFLLPAPADRLAAGFAIRRAILGDGYVDRAIAATSDLTRDFQRLLTEYAWGTIWTRPGLDHRTRRLLVLVITAALGRWDEFRIYLRAGFAHDLEPCDVTEALLHVAAYAGLPAANTAFRVADEERAAQTQM